MKRDRDLPVSHHKVGYGKPPTANRFRRGRSGNPLGKKDGEENIISAFRCYVLKRVRMKDGDQTRSITLAEAVILRNLNAALQKNPFAMSNMFQLAEASGEFIDRGDAKQVGGSIAVPERMTTQEFLAEFGRKVETE